MPMHEQIPILDQIVHLMKKAKKIPAQLQSGIRGIRLRGSTNMFYLVLQEGKYFESQLIQKH